MALVVIETREGLHIRRGEEYVSVRLTPKQQSRAHYTLSRLEAEEDDLFFLPSPGAAMT